MKTINKIKAMLCLQQKKLLLNFKFRFTYEFIERERYRTDQS